MKIKISKNQWKAVGRKAGWMKQGQAAYTGLPNETEMIKDPSCPPEVLQRVLERGEDDYVSHNAADNPNCPPEALAMVLKRGNNNLVSYNAAANRNCPAEALKMVLERGKDDLVSYVATGNPNCPPEALQKVLERGKSGWVSLKAVMNHNCPVEALKMVLERGKDNGISQFAARNPSCPPEALAMVLERGKDDHVSRCAADNRNCPAEALQKVLEREKDDWVSGNAANNPNCPPEARKEWMTKLHSATTHATNNQIKISKNQWKAAGRKAGWMKTSQITPDDGYADGGESYTDEEMDLMENTFKYYINLDERSEFYADVRDHTGKTVFEIKANDEEDNIFADGFMKHKNDLNGLKEYLVHLGIMQPTQRLIKGN